MSFGALFKETKGKIVLIRNHRKKWCRNTIGKIIGMGDASHYIVAVVREPEDIVWTWVRLSEITVIYDTELSLSIMLEERRTGGYFP